jgi:hypothetical protein
VQSHLRCYVHCFLRRDKCRHCASPDRGGLAKNGVLNELSRIVRPYGHVAFEVGEVRNGKIFLERLVWDAAEGLPFDRMFVMVNQQVFTTTANCWEVKNNAKGTNTNRIVVLRRL